MSIKHHHQHQQSRPMYYKVALVQQSLISSSLPHQHQHQQRSTCGLWNSLACKTTWWIINISFMNMIWIIIYLQTCSQSLIQYEVLVNTGGGGFPWQWQKPVKHILYIIREENMHQFIMLAVSYNTSKYMYLYISSCCFKAFGQTRRDAILNYWSLGCF